MSLTLQNPLKDPSAVLDYVFDWTGWLATGETISSYTVTAQSGITLDSDSATDDTVTVWLSGGTSGSRYRVSCKITTNAGRIDERSMIIDCQNR
ncbi:MAG: hypothetical protein WAO24_03565 [Peptococcia bacterium]|jgi:hypothetical protein